MLPPFTLRNREEIIGALLISAIALVMLSVVLWTIFHELRVRKWMRDIKLKKASAKATVERVNEIKGSTHITYCFTDYAGNTHRNTQTIFSLLLKQLFKAGDKIDVIYDPDDASLNYIDGYLNYYRKRETGYTTGFAQLLVFIVAFEYTQSFAWTIAAVISIPILKFIIAKFFSRKNCD